MTEELKLTNAPAKDERKGRPSASSMHRLFSCPGSWLAEQKCPALPPSPHAVHGTRMHIHMQNGTMPTDPSDIEAVEWCRQEEQKLVDEIFTVTPEVIREKRLWNKIDAYSGQGDVIYIADGIALILDYKFGRGEVQPAPENVQLLVLSALVLDAYFDVHTVYAGILQPFADNRNAYELAMYERHNEQNMRHTIRAAIDNAHKEDAPLNPSGMACKYCRAAATCPAAWQASLTQRDVQPLATMTASRIADLLDRAIMAERLAGAVKDAVKTHIQSGNEVPGWTITKGKTVSTISDPQEAFRRLNVAHGIDAEQFTGCCKVSMSSLDAVMYKTLNEKEKTTQKAARQELRALLSGCMEEKTSDGSLKKIYPPKTDEA